ncbi:MAG TPA: peptide ABC transporter substrate-binding protein [Candidatus Elarobacter sp.]|jgi:peptide/nickel transport system substrate-binding protein|nr:peptide ABC transporter substrate-binding protein [Candidatus Elarobacter sp.]
MSRTLRLLVLVAAATLAACAPAGAPSGPRTLRLAVAEEPHSLLPLLGQSITENEILRLIYDPLIACDAAGRPVPALAAAVPTRANGGISPDGLSVTYRLRRGVRWHDGTPFTSADVAASFRAVMDPRSVVQSRHGYDTVARVETPDAYTVRFRLKRRFAPFVGTVFAESDAPYYLAPAHLLRGGPLTRSSLNGAPVGTGPFEFVRWARGDRLELAANDRYWNGKPALARITIRFIADENTQLVALRGGDLDGVIGISANAAALARTIPHVRVATSALNAYWGVMMNNQPGRATADVRVRRAIAAAIDARAFRANVTHGFYAPAIADLPPVLWAADRSLKPSAFDPALARKLLAEAGYGPAHPLTLDLAIIQSSQTHRVESVAVQAQLRAVGADVRIHSYIGHVFDSPPAEGGILPRGRYDIAFFGWYAGMDPDDSGQFMCDQRPPNGYDHSFYCSAEMDAAQRDALASYDERVRKRAYARIEALLLRDVPIDFLASPVAISALRDDLTGFSPTLVTQAANAQRWGLAAH